jgi:disintegrin and metalloproteinase domain-containing protein 10
MFYETLHYSRDDVHSNHLRVQRATGDSDKEIIIHFLAYQKEFTLVLTPNDDSMGNKVRVHLVGSNGQRRTVDPDSLQREMYHGYVKGCPGSYVHGYIHDGVFDGVLHMENGTYHVEGAWKFYDGITPSQFHSIIYHEDDVKHHLDGNNSSYCGHQELLRKIQESAVPLNDNSRPIRSSHHRDKRVTPSGNTVCRLNLAVDYLFYTSVGSSSEVVTRNELSTILAEVNSIYSVTDFNFDRTADGVSFYVADITIYTSPNQPSSAYSQPSINVNSFLDLWSQENHDGFCLAMLLTYRDFQGGVLGLAWVAEPPGGNIGGVCTKRSRISSGERSLNTAIVTFLNFGRRQSRSVTIVTISHEFGHNFGSPHDPQQTGACSPGSSSGGNFIMFYSATDGSQPNNRKFSPCSVNSIRAVLESSRSDCFIPGANECGNGIVEAANNEECDCGDTTNRANCDMVDRCCDLNCKLLTTSECTPRGPTGANPCCSDQCSLIGASTVCQEESDCIREVRCNGRSPMCNVTTADYKEDGLICNSGSNTCLRGDCTGSICIVLSGQGTTVSECQCTGNDVQVCDVCCMRDGEQCMSTFELDGVNGTFRAAGRPCDDFKGYCAASVDGAPPQ